MKKFLVILLIPIFLLATGGVTINYLYCKGELSKVGIDVKPCCKDVNKGGCCDTKTKVVKVEDNFVKTVNQVDLSKLLVMEFDLVQPLYIIHYKVYSLSMYWDKAPPKDVSRYILFHSLII